MLLDLTPPSLTPLQAVGIPVALVGAVFLALGAQLQHRGVSRVDAGTPLNEKRGLGVRQLLALAARPSWLAGTVMLGLAILFQLISLALAPLTVVQPLGAVALVITSVVNSRVSGQRLGPASVRAIVFCVGGVALFVSVAASTTQSPPIEETQLIAVLLILVAVLVLLALAFGLFRKRFSSVFYIVAAGILFGFVATLAKVVIDRVHTLLLARFHLTPGDWLTILCVVGLVVASLLGSYFVQTAYSSGPPDLVVAGLTVIDPLIGVTIGIVVLGEAATAPWWAAAAFVIAGAIAIYGVFQLAKHHPELRR